MRRPDASEWLEWRIAWRHLEGADRAPPWTRAIALVASFLIVVGAGFALYAVLIGPAAGTDLSDAETWSTFEAFPGLEHLLPSEIEGRQQWFGTIGGSSLALGLMLGLFALLARRFTLLSTVITMSVLLGCMHLVVVLSLMSGLEQDLQTKILSQKSHIRISLGESKVFSDYQPILDALAELPRVAGASPYLRGEVLVRSGQ